MDGIFGQSAYKNAITWKRQPANNAVRNKCGRIADTLLFYGGSKATWNGGSHALSEAQLKRYKKDVDGRLYRCENLTSPAGSPETWRGTTAKHGWRHSLEHREKLWASGRIAVKRDGTPRLDGHKQYLDETPGPKLQNIWTDIPRVSNVSKERTGYPTQKPLALLERIIKASSNEGDVVLDPFCGCATTLVAAELLNRKCVGIDLSPLAAELVVQRIKEKRNLFQFRDIHHRTSIPIRTDMERRMVSTKKEKDELKNLLFLQQEQRCNLCHHEFPEPRHFEMDHIFPQAKGGQDWEDNFQLLCSSCNGIKLTGTQEEARARLVKKRGIDFTPFENGGIEVKRAESLDSEEERVAKKVLARLMGSGSLDEITEAVMGRVAEKGGRYGKKGRKIYSD